MDIVLQGPAASAVFDAATRICANVALECADGLRFLLVFRCPVARRSLCSQSYSKRS